MKQELRLTTMRHNPDVLARWTSFMPSFESRNAIQILSHELDWDSGWSDLVQTTIHGGSADVSELGTTWLNDFIAMNAIRPFSPVEVQSMGGEDAFFPSVFNIGVTTQGDRAVWAIPWCADLTMFYYRRSLFEKAGIDPEVAFTSARSLNETLQKLHDSGVEIPLVFPTQRTYVTVHNVALWVWAAGGDFFSPDGRSVLLDQRKVRQAFYDFYDLYRFMPPAARSLTELDADALFRNENAAVTLSGAWVLNQSSPEVRADLGIAVPFNCAFVGGSDFIIWKRTLQDQAALDLVRALTSHEAELAFAPALGMLPTRLSALEALPMDDETHRAAFMAGLRGGRPLPVSPLWGLVESKLVNTFANIWTAIQAAPQPDVESLVNRYLDPLTRRLNITLAER
jgi:multiple sugar transport system substrate-binding protein